MKKNVVYSLMALSAIPVAANAQSNIVDQAELPGKDWAGEGLTNDGKDMVMCSTGGDITYNVGTLQKGQYTLALRVQNKESELTVTVAGQTKKVAAADDWQDVTIEFDLDEAKNVTIKVSSEPDKPYNVAGTDINISETSFTEPLALLGRKITDAIVVVETYINPSATDDKLALAAIAAEINGMDKTYENYTEYKLYDVENSSLVGNIKEAFDTAKAHESKFALDKANAAIETAEDGLAEILNSINEIGDTSSDAYKKLKGEYDDLATALADFKAGIAKADETAAAHLYDTDGGKLKTISDGIDALTNKVNAGSEANKNAFTEIQDAITAAKAIYNTTNERLVQLYSDPNYAKDWLLDAQKELGVLTAKIAAVVTDAETANKAMQCVAKKAELMAALPVQADFDLIYNAHKEKLAAAESAYQADLNVVDAAEKYFRDNITGMHPKAQNLEKFKVEIARIEELVGAFRTNLETNNKNHTCDTYDTGSENTVIMDAVLSLKQLMTPAHLNFTANENTLAGVEELRTALTEANTAVGKLTSKDEAYKASEHYGKYTGQLTASINNYEAEANAALAAAEKGGFKTQEAVDYETVFNGRKLACRDSIDAYNTNAKLAMDNYDLIMPKAKEYNEALAALVAKVGKLSIWEACDYKGKTEAI